MGSQRLAVDRLTQLDGLRGVAAVVVLLSHAAATIPALGGTYYGTVPPVGGLAWWLSYSPLKIFTSGSEAVLIFFVLSGFVVTLPSLRFDGRGWLAYYPQRLIRLGLPFIAALIIGWGAVLVLPRTFETGMSPWLAGQQIAPTLHQAVRDLLLINPAPVQNNPLWSIRFEILFSLALPLYCLLARVPRPTALPLLILAAGGSGAALMTGQPNVAYLLLFAVGALINPLLPTLLALSARPWARSKMLTSILVAIGGLLLISSWLTRSWSSGLPILLQSLPSGLSVAGAALLVLVAIVLHPAATVLRTRPVQIAGRLSFSLYLVHVPVIATVAFLAPSWLPVALPFVALPVVVVLTLLFSRLIEGPSHRLSQRVGRAIRRRSTAAPEQLSTVQAGSAG